MGTILKAVAGLLILGGLYVWATGKSVTDEVEARAGSATLSASAILASEDSAPFDQEGTIVIDETQGQGGTPYILYTEYSDQGKPSVKTKRLVFENRDECAERNLPCATNQPGTPVEAGASVRVVGIQKNELVEVSELYVL